MIIIIIQEWYVILSLARAKEAARIAELEAEAAVLEKRRSLEEQKLCLQQEQVLSSIMEAALHSFVPNPINLESRKGERKVEAPIIILETKPIEANGQLSATTGFSTLNPEAAEWHHHPLTTNRKDCAGHSKARYEITIQFTENVAPFS